MEIVVDRIYSNEDVTISRIYIDGNYFHMHGLEDEYRDKKVPGETRIPAGTYELGLRTVGGFHNRYRSKFRGIHRGMLHVLNVPNFKYILIHVGNYDRDTDGCLLLGKADFKAGTVWQSKKSYLRFYAKVIPAVLSGRRVTITYIDSDR